MVVYTVIKHKDNTLISVGAYAAERKAFNHAIEFTRAHSRDDRIKILQDLRNFGFITTNGYTISVNQTVVHGA